MEEVFGEMVGRCVTEGEGAARNVRVVPGEGTVGTGWWEGRARFLLEEAKVGA